MKKILLIAVIALVGATGCVSKSVHNEVLGDLEVSNVELNNAKNEIKQLVRENEQLRREVDLLKNAMTGELSALNDKLEGMKGEKETLLNMQSDLIAKNEFLERENDRLMQKAGELKEEKERELAKVKETYESLVGEMKDEIESGQIKVTQAMDKLSVNFVEKILFDSGKAEIKEQGKAVLTRVGDILKKVTDKQIRVEGHTDNIPISSRLKKTFASNWELSAVRATTVVRFLDSEVGLAPAHMTAAGYSHYKPVADNSTKEGRAENRRIEIVLLPLDPVSVLEELKGEEKETSEPTEETSPVPPVAPTDSEPSTTTEDSPTENNAD